MMFLRPFARPILLPWLLVFALILSGPASVFAKVDMVNGRDGAEGDPGDGVESIGSGGGGRDLSPKSTSSTSFEVNRTPVYVDFRIVYVPGYDFVIIVEPAFLRFNDNRGGEE